MPHCFGLNARTRHLHQQPFRHHGAIRISKYLTTFKVGEVVDIKTDPSQHLGMPHKFYHGKTGRIFNVTKRAVGIIVNKRVGHRVIGKRIHVRIEHIRKSGSREDFLNRVRENDQRKHEAKKRGEKLSTKRTPAQPRPAEFIDASDVLYVNPMPFIDRQ